MLTFDRAVLAFGVLSLLAAVAFIHVAGVAA